MCWWQSHDSGGAFSLGGAVPEVFGTASCAALNGAETIPAAPPAVANVASPALLMNVRRPILFWLICHPPCEITSHASPAQSPIWSIQNSCKPRRLGFCESVQLFGIFDQDTVARSFAGSILRKQIEDHCIVWFCR